MVLFKLYLGWLNPLTITCFKWVETTNQKCICSILYVLLVCGGASMTFISNSLSRPLPLVGPPWCNEFCCFAGEFICWVCCNYAFAGVRFRMGCWKYRGVGKERGQRATSISCLLLMFWTTHWTAAQGAGYAVNWLTPSVRVFWAVPAFEDRPVNFSTFMVHIVLAYVHPVYNI